MTRDFKTHKGPFALLYAYTHACIHTYMCAYRLENCEESTREMTLKLRVDEEEAQSMQTVTPLCPQTFYGTLPCISQHHSERWKGRHIIQIPGNPFPWSLPLLMTDVFCAPTACSLINSMSYSELCVFLTVSPTFPFCSCQSHPLPKQKLPSLGIYGSSLESHPQLSFWCTAINLHSVFTKMSWFRSSLTSSFPVCSFRSP